MNTQGLEVSTLTRAAFMLVNDVGGHDVYAYGLLELRKSFYFVIEPGDRVVHRNRVYDAAT